MKTYAIGQEVALTVDLPEKGLKAGDVATVIEHHPVSDGEDGYSLEVFNAIGETIALVVVSESSIMTLSADEVLSVRSLALTS